MVNRSDDGIFDLYNQIFESEVWDQCGEPRGPGCQCFGQRYKRDDVYYRISLIDTSILAKRVKK